MIEMEDILKQVKAFKDADIKIHIITNDDYFYGGTVLKIVEESFILDDVKIGIVPLSYSCIKKITKFRDDRDDGEERT
jgi:hypothetical protein